MPAQMPRGSTYKGTVTQRASNNGAVKVEWENGSTSDWLNKSNFYAENSNVPWENLYPGVRALFTVEAYTKQAGANAGQQGWRLNAAQSVDGQPVTASEPPAAPTEAPGEPNLPPPPTGSDRDAGIHRSVALYAAVNHWGERGTPADVLLSATLFYAWLNGEGDAQPQPQEGVDDEPPLESYSQDVP